MISYSLNNVLRDSDDIENNNNNNNNIFSVLCYYTRIVLILLLTMKGAILTLSTTTKKKRRNKATTKYNNEKEGGGSNNNNDDDRCAKADDVCCALILPWFLVLTMMKNETNNNNDYYYDSYSNQTHIIVISYLTMGSSLCFLINNNKNENNAKKEEKKKNESALTRASKFDPALVLTKTFANKTRNEREFGVLFLVFQGLVFSTVSLCAKFLRVGIHWRSENFIERERVLVMSFIVVSCWMSYFLLLLSHGKGQRFNETVAFYVCAPMLVFLSLGVCKAIILERLSFFFIARLAALWLASILLSLYIFSAFKSKGEGETLPPTLKRKLFHVIAVVMFGIPLHTWKDDYGKILIPVAFASCLVLFSCGEYLLRSNGGTNSYFFLSSSTKRLISRSLLAWEKPINKETSTTTRSESDDEKYKKVVLSHISLLLGIAIPVWLYESRLESLAGLITIGVGDSIACLVGLSFGRMQINKTSKKTYEGFLAFLTSTVFVSVILSDYSLESFKGIVRACLAAAMIEASLESTLDNVVIPIVFLAFL